MCRVRSCCFCCSLRTGTYIAAIYTLLITVVFVISAIFALVGLGKAGKDFTDSTGLEQVGGGVQGDSKDESVIGKIVYYTTVIIVFAWFISAILVIVGVVKERRGFLMPWLIITIIMVVIAGIGVVMSCFEIKEVFEDGARAVSFCIQILMFALNVYMVIVVCSFYKNNLKEADER